MPQSSTWHDASVAWVLDRLGATPSGLGNDDARTRLIELGPNVLPRGSSKKPLDLVWQQVRGPLPMVLLGSGLLALVFGRIVDGLVVVAVVAVNAFIGAFQEFKAGRAIEALGALVPEYVTVLRDGVPASIPAAELVPGDIVCVEAGNRVPADMRLLAVRSLRVNEAALTGESVPTTKGVEPAPKSAAIADRSSMLFSGTMVVAGTGSGVVVATGTATELGHISALLRDINEVQTPLTEAMGRFGAALTQSIGVAAYFLVLTALRRGFPFVTAVRSGVSLVVAAVPSSLPAIITVALAVAVRRMARRNAIVRTLPSIETLGSTNVICSDKTGTLTRGEMVVRAVSTQTGSYELSGVERAPVGQLLRQGESVVPPFPRDVIDLLHAAVLCNDAALRNSEHGWSGVGDPIEVALLFAAAKLGFDAMPTRARSPRIDVIPFDSVAKCMATLHRTSDGASLVLVKGAPEVVLGLCDAKGRARRAIDRAFADADALAASGMRVLAVASRRAAPDAAHLEPSELAPLGLLGLVGALDPPRQEAIAAIEACHRAGMVVKMVTGDHASTAKAIGIEVGICTSEGRVVSGDEMGLMSDGDLQAVAPIVNVFSRVAPEHKLRLVRALQAKGNVVAMTGDGVNDAPALKQADVGVAMGVTGTAAAKEAAAVILVDDNFASIAAAVEGGRRCYDSLIKAIMFVVPTNIGQAFVLLVGVLAFPMVDGVPLLPIIPLQILWINLVTGVALAIPLAFEAPEPDLMRRSPRPRIQPIFTPQLALRCLLVGSLMAAGAVGLFLEEYYYQIGVHHLAADAALRKAQTMAATTVVLVQIFYLLQCRSLRTSAFAMKLFSNPAIYAGIAVTLAMHMAFVHMGAMNVVFHSAPLALGDWIVSALVAASVLPVITLDKSFHKKRGCHPR
jgi:magnesium-transporting ATPase (P-type)